MVTLLRPCTIRQIMIIFRQYLNRKILLGGTLLQPWPKTHSECESTLVEIMSFRPRNRVNTKKKGHHRDLKLHSAGVPGIYSCWRALFWLINQRWNLVGGTPNLDGGKRPPRPPYNLNTVSRVLGASEQAANWMYNSNKYTETLHHLMP